jgi:hypothetical protein
MQRSGLPASSNNAVVAGICAVLTFLSGKSYSCKFRHVHWPSYLNKPVFPFLSWHHALLALSPPPVPVSGDEIIDYISDRTRNKPKQCRYFPPATQPAEYFERNIGFEPYIFTVCEYHATQVAGVQTVPCEQLPSEVGLERSKTKYTLFVAQ